MGPSRVATSTELQRFLDATRPQIDEVLARWGERAASELGGRVGEAVAYSLAGPGKRFRPALVMATYRELGGMGDVTELAAAVEVVHTYSLVHDDLPCMDDDDLRRGRPTTHVQFDVATATEAGFRMVPLAARVLAAGATRLRLTKDATSQVGGLLFRGAGAAGMVGGQLLDLENEGKPASIEQLTEIHTRKTGALISACVQIGSTAAGADAARMAAVLNYAQEIGMAFQISDDVLDATASSTQLGKTAGKDERQNKATFATVLGLEAAAGEAERCVQNAIAQLGRGGVDSVLLEEMAQFIINRRH